MKRKAEKLAKAINSKNGDVYGEYWTTTEGDRTFHYVNVWRHPHDRYPSASVVVDDDGYTWGHQFEHTREPGTDVDALALTIIDTLPDEAR